MKMNKMGWANGSWCGGRGGGQRKCIKIVSKTERKDYFEGLGIDGRTPLN